MSTKKPSAVNVVFEDDDNHERLLYSGETTLSPGKFREEPITPLATFHAILYPPNLNLEGGKRENTGKVPQNSNISKSQQQTHPHMEPGPHWWETSFLTT